MRLPILVPNLHPFVVHFAVALLLTSTAFFAKLLPAHSWAPMLAFAARCNLYLAITRVPLRTDAVRQVLAVVLDRFHDARAACSAFQVPDEVTGLGEQVEAFADGQDAHGRDRVKVSGVCCVCETLLPRARCRAFRRVFETVGGRDADAEPPGMDSRRFQKHVGKLGVRPSRSCPKAASVQ